MARGKWGTPTIYNGRWFRSTLEAEWAEFLDKHGIAWEYEIGYFDLDGVRYLPDFWIPECRTILEVKGFLDDDDVRKITAFQRHSSPLGVTTVVAGSPVGRALFVVVSTPRPEFKKRQELLVHTTEELFAGMKSRPYHHDEPTTYGTLPNSHLVGYSHLSRCGNCRTWFIRDFDAQLNMACPVCGEWENVEAHAFNGGESCELCGLPARQWNTGADPVGQLQRYWQTLDGKNASLDDWELDNWNRRLDYSEVMNAMEIACARRRRPDDRNNYIRGVLHNALKMLQGRREEDELYWETW